MRHLQLSQILHPAMDLVMTRYAIYFAPHPDSLWHLQGSQWLGYDAYTGQAVAQCRLPDLSTSRLHTLTQAPARYGFHATLKAPFALTQDGSESQLLQMVKTFAAEQSALQLENLCIRQLGHFLAICPNPTNNDLDALAMRCVRYIDPLRAPPDVATLARRHEEGLSERQEVLLQRWGYPYTEEEFRFHMTISGSLKRCDAMTVARLHHGAEQHFLHVMKNQPLKIDALCIFRQEEIHLPFICWHRFPFHSMSTSIT